MLWFSGSIPEAITFSKQRKLPFVIYVEGQDESSTSMNAVWDHPKVSELFSKEKCVAVKLKNDSEECKQFSQLYPVVCVPSVFFIGQNGMPLELIGGAISVDEFIGKTNTAYESFQNQLSNAQETSQASQSIAADTVESTPISTVEERVEKAKQLIEQKRKEKAEKEKQDQLEKEMKRRKEGQEVTLAKKEMEERKQREIINQIREDKAKEKAAREAVLRQIAQDKAEREARKQNELRERKVASSSSSSTEVPSSSKTETTPKTTSTSTRLQFRMPDGSSEMKLFEAETQLLVAKEYIESLLDSRYKSVALTTIYPRRQLTEEDMSSTLSALNLVPSATLIVSPGDSPSAAVANSSSGLSGLFKMVLAPLMLVFNFIKTFLFGGAENPRGSYGGGSYAPRREEVKETGYSSRYSDDLGKRTGKQGFTNKEGNIHRIRNQDDDDDENNTWNGNSTQQM